MVNTGNKPKGRALDTGSALYFRDKLREARYLALADAEGFPQICYAIESLGSYLTGSGHGLGNYHKKLKALIENSGYLSKVAESFPEFFAEFDALYAILKDARNDAMHSGVYARHAAEAGINLCLRLEEALMVKIKGTKVSDFMIRNPVFVEGWQPVAFARQLMLANSFSFLPVMHDGKWCLLSEVGVAKYLSNKKQEKKELLMKEISQVMSGKEEPALEYIEAKTVSLNTAVNELLEQVNEQHTLWIVVKKIKKIKKVKGDLTEEFEEKLVGVLSPFELL